MRYPLIYTVVLFAILCIVRYAGDADGTYRLAYGTLGLMSGAIALTFLWLWRTRATPLASGMVLSWAGGGATLGWWWSFTLLGEPEWMTVHPAPLAIASLCLVGACLHFAVIGDSMGWWRYTWLAIPAACVATALSITLLI